MASLRLLCAGVRSMITTSVTVESRRCITKKAWKKDKLKEQRRPRVLSSIRKTVPTTQTQYVDENYFEKQADKMDLTDPKYIDKMCLLWTEMVEMRRDIVAKQNDPTIIAFNKDKWLPEIAHLQPRIEYENVPILKDAPESVRRVLSIEYGSRRDRTNAWKKLLIDLVRTSPLDTKSLEKSIAMTTALIRHWVMLKDEMAQFSPQKPDKLVVMIELALGRRRKLLRLLRESDTEAFNHVTEKLGLALYSDISHEPMELRRFQWVEQQIERRVRVEKDYKLEKLRLKFVAEKEKRLGTIDERLKEIDKLEAELKIELAATSEVLYGAVPANYRDYVCAADHTVLERDRTRHFYLNARAADVKKQEV